MCLICDNIYNSLLTKNNLRDEEVVATEIKIFL